MQCLALSSLLFCIGVYGLLTRRNLIGILMAVEILLNAAIINFIAFAYFNREDPQTGSIFSIFIIAIAACEMAVALAIVLNLYRKEKNLDVKDLKKLHG